MRNTYIAIFAVLALLAFLLFMQDIINFIWLFTSWGIIFMVSIIVIGNIDSKASKLKIKKMQDQIRYLKDFQATKQFVTENELIVIDEKNKLIGIKEKGFPTKLIAFFDLISCEIVEDGKTIFKSNNTLGRAVVGGLIAGGAGAIIGGLSSEKTVSKKISKLVLKLVVNNIDKSTYNIVFYDKTNIYGNNLEQGLRRINHWKDIFMVILNSKNGDKKSPN